MNKTLTRLWNDQEGQGMVEYALIIALVSIAAMAALYAMGTNVNGKFNSINAVLDGTNTFGS